MTIIPAEHTAQSLDLNPEEFIELYELIFLNGVILRTVSGPEIQWGYTSSNTFTWKSHLFKLSGEGRNSGEKRVRPTLSIGNPEALFHVPVSEGHLDGAIVNRYKVQPSALAANPPQFEKSTWYLAQVTGLGDTIDSELRSLSDRQESTLPARQYLRPEFPSVVI